jgi:peptidyl-prolyl cis-trans isomerase C
MTSLPQLRSSPSAPCASPPGWLATLAGAALLIGSFTAAHSEVQGSDPVLARVNGVDIHQSDLSIAEEEVAGSLPETANEQAKREYLITYMTNMILVSKAAEQKKLADGDDFKRRLAFARNRVLMDLMLQSEAKNAVTDEALHKVYDEATKQMGSEEEVHARHILVPTEEEAKAVEAELKKGADFVEVAKKKSKDPGAAEGGDLGYFTKDQMVPEFAEVAFKLDKGQISDPVKTQFGWHIIKVEDKRKRPVPTFDKVKDQLQAYVVRKAQSELITKLRAEGRIERLDEPAQGGEQKK